MGLNTPLGLAVTVILALFGAYLVLAGVIPPETLANAQHVYFVAVSAYLRQAGAPFLVWW